MNSEERRGVVYRQLASTDHHMETAGPEREDRMQHLDSDAREEQQDKDLTEQHQGYREAEERMLHALSREKREAYLQAKSKLLWEHAKGID